MPRLGFGAVTLGREIGEAASYSLLDRAYDLGFRIFDTAESYGGGNSEILLGRWAHSRGIRDTIEIHTKVSSDYSREGVRNSLHRSLERLQTEYVDAYYLHGVPAGLAEAISTLAELRNSGLARRIGICNATIATAAEAHKIASLDLCQHVYNLAQPEQARELIPWCNAQDVSFVAYSPLGAGFLTGKYGARGELAPKGTRFDIIPGHRDIYFRQECFDALERLTAVAARSGIPRHQLALAWVLQRTDIDVVLIGATRPEHLETAVSLAQSSIDGEILAQLA
jgi:aryl-alcohol dehydrogenase-like predicted oxidoreductase